MDIITAIWELTTFDHARCDAQIASHGIHVMVVKNGSSFQGVYIGSAFIACWLTAIATQTVRKFRNRADLPRRERPWLWMGPLLCVFGVVCITVQASGLIEYAGVCRSLLHLP